MPYLTILEQLDYDKSDHYWQIRVHIDPSAIDESNPQNKIAELSAIFKEVFKSDAVDVKLFQITPTDIADGNNSYDGALDNSGKDRTQVGKEVCIYLPNAGVNQLSTKEYKDKLLLVWKKLEDAKIPLLYLNVPGDKAVPVSQTGPSPFSFSSNNPDRNEWNDKHGILFKEFKAHGNHPILGVNFSLNDLKKHNIHYTFEKDLKPTATYLHKHRKDVKANNRNQIEALLIQKNYRDIIFDDALSLNVLTAIIKDAEESLNKASPDEKGQAQTAIGEKILANEAYQLLVNSYPHEADKDFSAHPAIQEIKATIGKRLTPDRAAELIKTLRHDYDKKIEEIKNDCSSYIDLGTDSEAIDTINHNPAKMQAIFRRQALISQEVDANPYYNPIIPLLDGYKAERENRSSHEYTGLFGKLKRAFGAYSKQEKHEAIDALLAALYCPSENKLERKHIGALKQGELGKLVKTLDIKLETYAKDAGKNPSQSSKEKLHGMKATGDAPSSETTKRM